MTPEETRKLIEVMQAYVDGKEIEYYSGKEWIIIKSPKWNWNDMEYRIKPKEKISIPATEDEIQEMDLLGRIVKNKDNGHISIVGSCNLEAVKNNFYFYNPETKCWEDWGDK